MRAKGGASASKRRSKTSRSTALPCASIRTPSGVLPTLPVSPQARAERYTKGRNPTPCTWPVTIYNLRSISVSVSASVRRVRPLRVFSTAGRPSAGAARKEFHVS